MTIVVPRDVYALLRAHSLSHGDAWDDRAVAEGIAIDLPDDLVAQVQQTRAAGESFGEALRRGLTAMAAAEGIDLPAPRRVS